MDHMDLTDVLLLRRLAAQSKHGYCTLHVKPEALLALADALDEGKKKATLDAIRSR